MLAGPAAGAVGPSDGAGAVMMTFEGSGSGCWAFGTLRGAGGSWVDGCCAVVAGCKGKAGSMEALVSVSESERSEAEISLSAPKTSLKRSRKADSAAPTSTDGRSNGAATGTPTAGSVGGGVPSPAAEGEGGAGSCASVTEEGGVSARATGMMGADVEGARVAGTGTSTAAGPAGAGVGRKSIGVGGQKPSGSASTDGPAGAAGRGPNSTGAFF